MIGLFWGALQVASKTKHSPWSKCQLLVRSCMGVQMSDTLGQQMAGFRGEKSTRSQRVSEWNSKQDDRDALATRGQGEEEREGGGWNRVAKCAPTQRKHDASLRHRVMDGAHRLINQRRWKGRMLRRVFGATLPRALGCRERRNVSGMWEQMLAHRERRAWPNLARLMKNGQESAYLARPSLRSAAAPPHFLLPLTPTLGLPPLYLPCPFHSLCLSLIPTLWSLLSPRRPPTNTDISCAV